jgi:glycosyltransferase involved in cell wall biosynthesis
MTSVTWVAIEPPDLTLGGGSIREAHLLRAMARTAETHLVLAGRLRDESLRSLLASVTELDEPAIAPPANPLGRRLRDLWRAAAARPAEVADLAPTVRAMRPILEARPTDVVCIAHHGLATLLPDRRTTRWVLTMQNLPSVVAEQTAAVLTGRRRWLITRQQHAARRFERWAVEHYDLVVTVADDDARALPGPSVVVPNGVDVDAFPLSPLPSAPALVFTGTLGYLPNVDGITWVCDQVLPRIRNAVPDVTLDIVGRAPTPAVQALAALAGVSVSVDVPDIGPHLRAGRVSIVPLRIGSGTRLKALEAMAGGRPVVGTAIGLAGLGIRDRDHALIADRPADFADAVVSLLQDDELAQRLVDGGRRLVTEQFAWSRIAPSFTAAVLGASEEDGAHERGGAGDGDGREESRPRR